MTRVKLVTAEDSPQVAKRLDAIAQDRGQVNNAYRMLANSPMVLERVYEFLKGFWHESELEPLLREMLILRIAQLLDCDYEWARHRDLAREAGATDDKVRELADWSASAQFNDSERAAFAVADSATQRVVASAEEVAELKVHFTDRQVVELLALIGLYGMLARLLRSLDVDLEPGDVGLAR